MSGPSVRRTGNVFTFTWKDEGIEIRIDHVRQHTSGDMSAEIVVRSARPGQGGHVHHSLMSNLLGPRIRDGVVRSCASRVPGLPWESFIETVCENVADMVRDGRPASLLADVPMSESLAWRLHPLLYEKAATVIFGKGGSLKSTIAAWIAIRVALGLDCEPGNVLVLDWESDAEDWKKTVLMVAEGLDCGEPPNIWYQWCSQPLASDIERLVTLARSVEAQLVITDSAAFACGGEPEKAEPTMEYFRALREFDCTTLTIAHQNGDDNTKKPYGNVFWVNSPRSCIQVIRSDDDHDTIAEVGLYQRKRNHGRKWKPVGFRATFDTTTDYNWTEGDKVSIEQMSITEIPELASTLSISSRVYEELKHGRMTLADLSEALPDLNPESLRVEIYRMRKRGILVELPLNHVGLADGSFSPSGDVAATESAT